MASQMVSVPLPAELISEIDSAVGQERRAAFLAESASEALKRKALKEFLANPEPTWKDEDHPELVELGTAGWVDSIRQESEDRFRRIFERD